MFTILHKLSFPFPILFKETLNGPSFQLATSINDYAAFMFPLFFLPQGLNNIVKINIIAYLIHCIFFTRILIFKNYRFILRGRFFLQIPIAVFPNNLCKWLIIHVAFITIIAIVIQIHL